MSDAGEKPPVTFAVCNKGDVGTGGGRGGSLISMYAPKRMMMKNNGNNNSRDNEIDTSSHSDAISTNSSPLNDHPPSGSNGATYHHQQQQRPRPTQLRRQSSPHIDLDDGLNNIDNSNRSSMSGQSRRSSDNTNTDKPLWARLTNQRWHEIGNGEYPLCATDDFDLMVEQLTSVLASRLTAVLIDRLTKARKQGSGGGDGSSSSINNGREYLQLDMDAGDYVLADDIMDTLREYVACIGRLHNNVGFHSFEHATHVFLSMNKLLSMITTADDLNVTAKRRLSAQDIATSAFSRSRRSSTDSGSSGDCDSRKHAEHLSFRISEDPAIRFAMVFSALIHDVGHTGVPNSVLIEEEDELAILHNDVSVAEQNSLQLAFSLLQKEEFQLLKRCIGPTPAEHKLFRKKVIGMVMVTDISDQERLQIVKSRWNAAFPPPEEDDKKEEPQQIMEIKSAELKQAARRRRFTMFTSEASALEFANERRSRRLGIRTSMDFSGMMIEAYRDTDQLQQHAVLETMMNVADVAHTMQSFNIFVKWNRKLYKEFYVGHLSGRLPFDPSKNWYENQIGFFSHYIIPLAQKMAKCGVFGSAGCVFEYFAKENRKRWTEEGEEISETIISEVAEEVEREREQQ